MQHSAAPQTPFFAQSRSSGARHLTATLATTVYSRLAPFGIQTIFWGTRISNLDELARQVAQLGKPDVRAILLNRLNAFSNEDIENLVMETAGREIKAIVWFGAGIGLIIGIFQTLINFL